MKNMKAIRAFLEYQDIAKEAKRLNKIVGRLLVSEPGSRSCRIQRSRRSLAEEAAMTYYSTHRCSIEHGRRIIEGINQ